MTPPIGRSRLPELFKKTRNKRVDLARYLDVSKSYITLVCSNKRELSVYNMRKTAIFFGCSMDDLVDWVDELKGTAESE
jgi:transcriptional regulator with XRE-family HTH domain